MADTMNPSVSGVTLLSPLLDLVFKLLLEDERLLRSMLDAVLGLKDIESLEILNPGLPPDIGTGKLLVLDVRVKLADGSLVDIEMQGKPHPGFSGRVLMYWARMYSSQVKAGDDYTRLRPARVICWLGENFIRNDIFHNTFQVRSIDDGTPWPCSDLELHTLE